MNENEILSHIDCWDLELENNRLALLWDESFNCRYIFRPGGDVNAAWHSPKTAKSNGDDTESCNKIKD